MNERVGRGGGEGGRGEGGGGEEASGQHRSQEIIIQECLSCPPPDGPLLPPQPKILDKY